MKGFVIEKRSPSQRAIFIIVFILFGLYALSLVYPFIWALYNSLKDQPAYNMDTFGLPKVWHWENYVNVFKEFTYSTATGDKGIFTMFFNSILLVGLTTFSAVIGSACVAYVVSKFKFFGSNFIYTAAVFIMVVPTIGLTPALYKITTDLQLRDSILVCAIIMGGCFGMYFMMMYGTFKSLSWTYAEAGYMDGANDFTIFFRIMMPQVMPQVMALCLVCAIGVWNDYFYPYVFTPNKPTISTGLYTYQTAILDGSKEDYPMFFTALLICCVPMLVVFACFQNTLMNNASTGGIKG